MKVVASCGIAPIARNMMLRKDTPKMAREPSEVLAMPEKSDPMISDMITTWMSLQIMTFDAAQVDTVHQTGKKSLERCKFTTVLITQMLISCSPSPQASMNCYKLLCSRSDAMHTLLHYLNLL